MPTQIWKVTLQPEDSSADCWFFREQQDVQVAVQRLDENPDIEWKAQYRTSPSVHQAITIDIVSGQPPFYAVMTELKLTATRKKDRQGTLIAIIQVTWPFDLLHR
jgi:hypothetical protein